MNSNFKTTRTVFTALALIATAALSGCKAGTTGGTGKPGGGTIGGPGGPAAVTNSDIPGTGSTSVPTADAVATRIEVGLQGNVSRTAGSFSTAFNQFSRNLANVTNPLEATGYENISLIVYAACTDINSTIAARTPTSSPPGYGVTFGGTLAAQSANLISAGIQMVNQHTGGLASSDPALNTQVRAVFQNLLNAHAGTAPPAGSEYVVVNPATSRNTQSAFVSICMAANVFGVTGRGF
jgi:hypothetical protein